MLLLIDVGGSMDPHTQLCERLFSAAHRASHFKKFESRFFHNCVYEKIYTDISRWKGEPTKDMIKRIDDTWTVVLVGDAWMSPYELTYSGGALDYYHENPDTGLEWLKRLRRRCPKSVWLNPEPKRHLERADDPPHPAGLPDVPTHRRRSVGRRRRPARRQAQQGDRRSAARRVSFVQHVVERRRLRRWGEAMTAVRSLSPSTARALVVAAALALAAGPTLLAAEPVTKPAEDEGQLTETVVVTASRIEQPEGDVAANVTVVTADEIGKAASFATDEFLRRVPGFTLFRRASSLVAHPTTQGVSLRGVGPSGVSRTLVLLDGVPLNDPFGGWVYWGRVPMPTLERVEIVRGGASNVWGNSALGGVVHLFTRDPDPATFLFGLDYGERSTYLVDALASNRWKKSAGEIHADRFDTDGFFVVPAEQRGAIDIPAFSEHWNLGGRYDLYPADSWTVSLRAGGFDEERGNGTPLTNNDTELQTASAQFDAVTSNSTQWRGSFFGQDQTFASTFSTQAPDRSSEVPALDQFDTDADAWGLNLQWVRSFDGDGAAHVLTAGGEGRDVSGDDLEHFRLVNGAFASLRQAGGDQQLFGVFLQDTISFHDRVQLQIGARGDRWESSDGIRRESSIATGAVTRLEQPPDRDETEFSPRVSALWKPRDGVGLKASAYQAFRAPSINELYRPFRVRNDITEANAALEPETLTGAELGAEFRGPHARLEITPFWNEVEDAISNVTVGFGPATVAPCGLVPAGGVCRQRQNLNRVEIQGVEAELEWRPMPRWRFLTSYLYSDTEITDAPQQPELEGNRLAQVPESQGSVTLEWSDPRLFTITTMGRIATSQWEDDLNTLDLATAIIFDLAVQVPIGDRFNAFLSLENVSDERIESGRTADGLLTIGTPFIIHGGVRFHLARRAGA